MREWRGGARRVRKKYGRSKKNGRKGKGKRTGEDEGKEGMGMAPALVPRSATVTLQINRLVK